MDWKLLREGEIARCRCGRETFVQVGRGRVLWFRNLQNNAPIPDGVDVYLCKEPRCKCAHRRYLALSTPATQVHAPPPVAA